MTDATIAQQVAGFFTMDAEALRAEYRRLLGEEPKCRSATWLRKNLSWRVQHDAQPEPLPPRRVAPLRPGVVLVRVWRGHEYRLLVRDDDYVLNGVPYRTLHAAAFAVTNAHWNPKLFWGLTPRKQKVRKS